MTRILFLGELVGRCGISALKSGLSGIKSKYDIDYTIINGEGMTGGYGIGLSVARAHARGLGGDLTVAARPGGGCAFTFEIPVSRKEEEGK